MGDLIQWKFIVASVVYSLIGIVVLVLSFWIIEKISPQNLYLEIVDKKNMAVALVAAAFIIAIAIIVSSAIHG